MKTLLLSAFLFLASLTGLCAQDKYQFAVITYTAYTKTVSISINGSDFREEKAMVAPSEAKSTNANPLLLKLNQLQEQGWEVLKIDGVTYGNELGFFGHT